MRGVWKNTVIQVLYGIVAIVGYFKNLIVLFLSKTQYFRFRLLQLFK
jgi:hypothetical protein